MSKEKNLSVNDVIKKHPSNYLSITKLIANARPDHTNPDWVNIQQAAKAGNIKKVDDLLSDSKTNYAAKKSANDAVLFFAQSPKGASYNASVQSILSLYGAEGYIQIPSRIIDSTINQINTLQKQVDEIPGFKRIMTSEAQIELTQQEKALKEQLNNWQTCLEIDIDRLLAIGVNRGHSGLIEMICNKCQEINNMLPEKFNLDTFNPFFPIENTFLVTAAKLNHLPVVRVLLKHKADPNAGNGKVEMPLIHAIINGNIKMAQLLIKHGAKLDGIAIHRGSVVDENGGVKFFENEINVEDAIKKALNLAEMDRCINEIKSKGEFFAQEMSQNGVNSPILSWLNATDSVPDIIEEEILGQNPAT